MSLKRIGYFEWKCLKWNPLRCQLTWVDRRIVVSKLQPAVGRLQQVNIPPFSVAVAPVTRLYTARVPTLGLIYTTRCTACELLAARCRSSVATMINVRAPAAGRVRLTGPRFVMRSVGQCSLTSIERLDKLARYECEDTKTEQGDWQTSWNQSSQNISKYSSIAILRVIRSIHCCLILLVFFVFANCYSKQDVIRWQIRSHLTPDRNQRCLLLVLSAKINTVTVTMVER